MKILINLSRLVPAAAGAGGAGWFSLTLCRALGRTGHQVSALVSIDNQAYVRDIFRTDSDIQLLQMEYLSGPSGKSAIADIDVYIDPLNDLERIGLPARALNVTVIHDLQFMENPHMFTNEELQRRRIAYESAIQRADLVLTTSISQLKLIQSFSDKASVQVLTQPAYFTASSLRTNDQQKASRYFVFPSVQWNHKNHYRLVQAFAFACTDASFPADAALLISGVLPVEANTNAHWQLVNLLPTLPRERIKQVPYLTPRTFEAVMEHASGLVYPSLYEGYGLPVIEAAASGLPILTTQVPSLSGLDLSNSCIRLFRNPLNSFTMAQDLIAFANEAQSLRGRRLDGIQTFEQFAYDASNIIETAFRNRQGPAADHSSLWPLRTQRASGTVLHIVFTEHRPLTQYNALLGCIEQLRRACDLVAILPLSAASIFDDLDWFGIRRSYYASERGALDLALVWELQFSQRRYAAFVLSSELGPQLASDLPQAIEWLLYNSRAVRVLIRPHSHRPLDWPSEGTTQHLLGTLIAVEGLGIDYGTTPASALRCLNEVPFADNFEATKFIIIDPALKETLGHHALVARCMAAGARQLAHQPIVFANEQCDSNLLARFAPVQPKFKDHLYGHSDVGHIYDGLEDIAASNSVAGADTIAAFCATPSTLAGLILFLARRPASLRPTISIRFDRTEAQCPRDPISYSNCFERIRELGLRNHFRFFVESVGLQEYFAAIAKERFPILFNPAFSDFQPLISLGLESADAVRADEVAIGFVGEARLEKGFQLLPNIVSSLLADKALPRLRFKIQVSSNPRNDDLRIAAARAALREIAKRHSNVELYEYLSDGEYYEVFQSIDVLLLPYLPHYYRTRGSGIASEALAAGCALVVSHGIDIARTLRGCGLVEAASGTNEAFLDACKEAISNVKALRVLTADYRMKHSVSLSSDEHFVQSLMRTDFTKQNVSAKKVLWIANDTEGQGSSVVYAGQLSYLAAQHWNVFKLIVPYPAVDRLGQSSAFDWQSFFATWQQTAHFRQSPEITKIAQDFRTFGNSYERFVRAWQHLSLPDPLRDFLKGQTFDLAIVNYDHHRAAIDSLGLKVAGPIILEAHDVQARQYAIQQDRLTDTRELADELKRAKAFEHVVSISASEASEFRQAGANAVSWILPCMPYENSPSTIETPARFERLQVDDMLRLALGDEKKLIEAWHEIRVSISVAEVELLIVASDHHANVKSTRWFLSEVFAPFLAKSQIRLRIVGDVAHALDSRALPPGIELVGRAANLDPYYEKAKVIALPIVSGAGVPIKVLDAFARRRPFSLMSFPSRALGLPNNFPVCDSAAAMAADIEKLLTSDSMRDRRAAIGNAFYLEHASRTHYFSQWSEVVSAAHERYRTK